MFRGEEMEMYVSERGEGDVQVLLCDKMDAFLNFQEYIKKILNHINLNVSHDSNLC